MARCRGQGACSAAPRAAAAPLRPGAPQTRAGVLPRSPASPDCCCFPRLRSAPPAAQRSLLAPPQTAAAAAAGGVAAAAASCLNGRCLRVTCRTPSSAPGCRRSPRAAWQCPRNRRCPRRRSAARSTPTACTCCRGRQAAQQGTLGARPTTAGCTVRGCPRLRAGRKGAATAGHAHAASASDAGLRRPPRPTHAPPSHVPRGVCASCQGAQTGGGAAARRTPPRMPPAGPSELQQQRPT